MMSGHPRPLRSAPPRPSSLKVPPLCAAPYLRLQRNKMLNRKITTWLRMTYPLLLESPLSPFLLSS